MRSFAEVVAFTRENYHRVIKEMRSESAMNFIKSLNFDNPDESKDLGELRQLKIKEEAFCLVEEIFDRVLKLMATGESINNKWE